MEMTTKDGNDGGLNIAGSRAAALPLDLSYAVAQMEGRLLQSKLMKPLGQSFAASGRVTAADLRTDALRLFDTQSYLRQLFPFAADQERAGAALAQIDLPEPMAVKLAEAREQRPRLFDHLLIVALICHYVSQRLRLAAQENVDLLLAALLHDLGELHTDPALLEQGHRLARDEMRYIYAHPITGALIAKAVAPENPEVATAVLQHHERLDGSGYPHGLREDAIGRLGRIVGAADACAAILARFGNSNRLSALISLNRKKYPPALIALLHQAFGVCEEEETADEVAVLPQLKAMEKLLKHWGDFRAELAGTRSRVPPPELAFLFERMSNLNALVVQFGFDPDSLQILRAAIAADRKITGELAAALNEVRWQFADLEREILRRKEIATKVLPADKCMLIEDWLADLRRYLEEVDTPI